MDDSELSARLKAAHEKQAAIAEAREAANAKAMLLHAVEAAELAARNESALADAEAAHGPLGRKIAAVDTDLGVVILKRPNHLLFRKFQDTGEATFEGVYRLVRPCLVYPDVETFDRWLEEQSGILARCGGAVATLAGIRAKDLAGK